jgi:hypothetical protein
MDYLKSFMAGAHVDGNINSFRLGLAYTWVVAQIVGLAIAVNWGTRSPVSDSCPPWSLDEVTHKAIGGVMVLLTVSSWVFFNRCTLATHKDSSKNSYGRLLYWLIALFSYLAIISAAFVWGYQRYYDPNNPKSSIEPLLILVLLLGMTTTLTSRKSGIAGALMTPFLLWAVFLLFTQCSEMYCFKKPEVNTSA